MATSEADPTKSDSCIDPKDDFIDPLGANDPLHNVLDDQLNGSDFDIEPLKSSDIDAVLAATRKEFESLRTSAKEEEEDEQETKDLFVVVDNPEKHATTMESYITFRVTTKTSRSDYDSPEFQVRRRYNDFLWLRQRLADTQPTHIVPPLPEKHSLRRLDRFNPEFVKTRQTALQKFLQRIADHPVLSFNKNFQTFLTAKQWEFQAAKKEGSGFMSRWADSFHNLSASYMMKNRPPEFTVMSDYIYTFSEKLGVMDRISQRIMKEQYEYLAELNEWGPIFTLWSNSEERLSLALGAMAKSVEKNFIAMQELVESTDTEFNNPLKEYALYADSVKAGLRRRDAIQMEFEMTHDELNKKKEEREQVDMAEPSTMSFGSLMGKDPELIREEKIEKIEQKIKELTKQVEVLNDKMVCANADLKADMERWHKNKRKDFKQLFMAMADREIKYYEQCMHAWEDAISPIQRTDQGADSEKMNDFDDSIFGASPSPNTVESESPPRHRQVVSPNDTAPRSTVTSPDNLASPEEPLTPNDNSTALSIGNLSSPSQLEQELQDAMDTEIQEM